MLHDVATAVGRCIRLSGAAGDRLLAADDQTGEVEPQLRRGLRAVREDLRLWRTTVGEQRQLERGLDRLLHPETPGLLRLRVRRSRERLRRAEVLLAQETTSNPPMASSASAEDAPVADTVPAEERTRAQQRALGAAAIGLAIVGGLLVFTGACVIGCGDALGVLWILLGLVVLGLAVAAVKRTKKGEAMQAAASESVWLDESRRAAHLEARRDDRHAARLARQDAREDEQLARLEPVDPARVDAEDLYPEASVDLLQPGPTGTAGIQVRQTLDLPPTGWVATDIARAPDTRVFFSAEGRVRGPNQQRSTPLEGSDRITPLVVGLPPGVLLARVDGAVLVVGPRSTLPAGPRGTVEVAINAAPGTLRGSYLVTIGTGPAR